MGAKTLNSLLKLDVCSLDLGIQVEKQESTSESTDFGPLLLWAPHHAFFLGNLSCFILEAVSPSLL